ncbi:Pentatricopeptide repeat-containing protein [Acorus calamus]|uniref:Pentatricopeptide repeat-containing protein n=1 Tax=Acorus calamus TaxID=4465 RepID=A0AAV9EJQ6_ACOCL|nr:Pentatricopeptide repeat-containing protein [Acorus calamus]
MENSAVVQIINACISLGWLERAHDLLDEMKFSRVRIGGSIYSTLLKAYCKANRPREITALLKEAQKAGIQLDSGCYEAMIETRVLDLFKEMKGSNISKAGNRELKVS